jgi:hypothetical protein
MGLDQALRDYRGWEEPFPLQKPGPSHDPWNEDLFYRRLPAQPPVIVPERKGPKELGAPNAFLLDPRQGDRAEELGLGEKPFDEPTVRSSASVSWIVEGLRAVAGLLATLCVLPAISRNVPTGKGHAGCPIPTKVQRVDPCRANSSCCEPD